MKTGKTERMKKVERIAPDAFKKWLRKKGLTVEGFSLNAGVHVNTVEKWAYIGAMPREAYAQKVKAAFPDCPLSALA